MLLEVPPRFWGWDPPTRETHTYSCSQPFDGGPSPQSGFQLWARPGWVGDTDLPCPVQADRASWVVETRWHWDEVPALLARLARPADARDLWWQAWAPPPPPTRFHLGFWSLAASNMLFFCIKLPAGHQAFSQEGFQVRLGGLLEILPECEPRSATCCPAGWLLGSIARLWGRSIGNDLWGNWGEQAAWFQPQPSAFGSPNRCI